MGASGGPKINNNGLVLIVDPKDDVCNPKNSAFIRNLADRKPNPSSTVNADIAGINLSGSAMSGLGVPARGGNGKSLGAILCHHLAEALGDLIHRLGVGDLLPLVRAAFPDALQRLAQAILVIVNMRRRGSLVANVFCQHRVFVRANPGQVPVFRLRAHLTADVTDRTNDVPSFRRIHGCFRGAHG